MAVIDLGKDFEPGGSQESTPQASTESYIDLTTGERVVDAPKVSPDDFVMGDAPAEALNTFTPDEIAEMPELGYLENQLLMSGGIGPAFRMAMGSLLSSEPKQQIDIINEVLPEASVKTLTSGETVVNYNDQNFVINKPGVSATDLTRFAGQFIAFLPAAKITTMAGKGLQAASNIRMLRPVVNGAVKQRAGQMAAGGTAAAATSAALDVGAAEVGGGYDQGDVSGERALITGMFGAAAELIGPAFRMAVSKFRGTPDDLKYIDLEEVRKLKKAEEITGINLLEPQATKARADSVYMRALQDIPETQKRMLSILDNQNQEASATVTNFVADIADAKASANAPKLVRDTAIESIDAMKEARANMTKQAYTEATGSGTQVNVQPTLTLIDSLLAQTSSSTKSTARNELSRIRDLIAADTVDGLNDIGILHNVKMELDNLIESGGLQGLGGVIRTNTTNIKNSLVGAMDEASPQYEAVKDLYKEASAPINKLESGLTGRLANIKDENLKRVLPTIFDAGESNPEVLRQARQIIEGKSPEAWQQLVRANINRNMEKISTLNIEGVPNTPQQLRRALFGANEAQRRMFYDSLTTDQADSAKWIEMALGAAARGRKQGSDTAGKTEAISELKRTFGGDVENYFNPITWGSRLTGAMQQARFERRANAMVDAIMDSNWSAEMAKLKEMNPTDSISGRSFIQALARIENSTEEEKRVDKFNEVK